MTRLRPLKKSERRLLTGTVTLALLLGIYANLIEPRVVRARELHEQLATVRSELAEYQYLLDNRESILSQADWLRKQIGSTSQEDMEMKLFLQEVEHLARGSNMQTVSLRPQRVRDAGHYRLLNLDLVAEGNENEVGRFLHALSDSNQLLRVERMQINSMRQSGRIQVNLHVVRILSPRGKS